MGLLDGKRVLVTRPGNQAENLCALLAGQGAIPVRYASLAIAPVNNKVQIQAVLNHLENWQWLFFISPNAVTMHSYYLDGVKIKRFESLRVAAVGNATAKALKSAGMPVDLVPETDFNSEALLASPELQHLEGQRCLIVRGVGGREKLAETLRARGANVDYLEVYQRLRPEHDNTEVHALLEQNLLAAVTITSGEALQNLLTMLGEKFLPHLQALPLVVVSDRIKKIAVDLGFNKNKIAVTKNPSDAAILQTVITCVTGELSGRIE